MISSQATTRPEMVRTNEILRIVIPAVIRPSAAFWLTLWLAGWTFGLLLLPFLPLVPAKPLLDTALRIVAIPLWLYAWVLGLHKLVYGLCGEERVVVSPARLAVRRQVLGFGPQQTHPLPTPATWRLSPRRHWVSDADDPMRLGSRPGGAITLRSGRRAIRFGRNLTREQADEILGAIQDFSRGFGRCQRGTAADSSCR